MVFGHPWNTLIPFLQFLAPVLTSYLLTFFGPVILLVIAMVFVLITKKIYKLKIKKEFVEEILLVKDKNEDENKDKNKNGEYIEVKINEGKNDTYTEGISI